MADLDEYGEKPKQGKFTTMGANTLRAPGPKSFSARTLLGNFPETRLDPGTQWGPRNEARTETQIRAREATAMGRPIPAFGSALEKESGPGVELFDRTRPIAPDKRRNERTWRSSAQAAFGQVDPRDDPDGADFRPQYKMQKAMPKEKLQEYQRRWISNDQGAATRRFGTELARSQKAAVTEPFREPQVRRLQGLPRAQEELRRKAGSRFGALALFVLRRTFQSMDTNRDRQLSRAELQAGLVDMGMSLSVDEVEELFRSLDTDRSGAVSYEELVSGMAQEELSPVRDAELQRAFAEVQRRSGVAAAGGAGGGVVTRAGLEACSDMTEWPDVRAGKYAADDSAAVLWSQFGASPDSPVSIADMRAVFRKVSAVTASDDQFVAMLRRVFRLPRPAGEHELPTLVVLVTHADGSKTMQSLPKDEYLNRSDKADLLRRLKARGVDAVDVSFDF